MSAPAQKCEKNTIFKENFAQKLFIAFKMANSCCFGLKGNLDFPDFQFYNINYRSSTLNINEKCLLIILKSKLLIFSLKIPSDTNT